MFLTWVSPSFLTAHFLFIIYIDQLELISKTSKSLFFSNTFHAGKFEYVNVKQQYSDAISSFAE